MGAPEANKFKVKNTPLEIELISVFILFETCSFSVGAAGTAVAGTAAGAVGGTARECVGMFGNRVRAPENYGIGENYDLVEITIW